MWRKKSSKIKYGHVVVEELPTLIKQGIIYVEGRKSKYWIVAFKCPCGCMDTIYLNLLKEAEPCWRVKIHWLFGITIFPSINRITGCRSHFIVENGKVYWSYFRY